jgi:hypothetical protein
VNIAWQVYVVVFFLVTAAGGLTFMLVYRARHKTNIETNLLLKQMRITSRMRGALDVQKDYLEALDGYHEALLADWEAARRDVRTRCGMDIGEMRMPPEPETDMNRLLATVDRG